MAQRELEIVIGADGNVQVHVQGYKGKSCLEAARFLEELIGRTESRQLTSEYYEPDEEVRFRLEQRQ